MTSAVFGPEYPKINTIFNRTGRGIIIPDEYSTLEIEYLANSPWNWTEKVDGTNIRLYWNGGHVTVGGRTNGESGSQLEAGLVDYIYNIAGVADRATWQKAFPDCDDVTLYGEGFGRGIRSGGQYLDHIEFILFDVRIGEWWLRDDDIRDVAEKMDCQVVPKWGTMSVVEAWEVTKSGVMKSHWPGAQIEGLVGRPAVDFYSRKGERVVAKTKVRDWADYQKEQAKLLADADLEAKRAEKKAAGKARYEAMKEARDG